MADLHEAVFRWPYAGEDVTLTGTFDHWSRSIRLIKGPSGFEGTVGIPWSEKVAYKFIVDGRWATTDLAPTELDGAGNINNVYYAPAKPTSFTNVDGLSAVAPAERPQARGPDPPAVVEGKIPEAPKVLPPVANGTFVVPVSPLSLDQPVSSPAEKPVEVVDPVPPPVANGKPAVPVPQDESPGKQLPTVPGGGKPVKTADPVVALPTEPQVSVPKIPLPVVPVNDSKLVSPSTITTPQSEPAPSTHTPFVNSPRKSLNGTSPLVPAESQHKADGTNETSESVGTSSSPPTTPKKHAFPSSRSDSPTSPRGASLRSSKFGTTRSKRHSFLERLKHVFTPEKHKEKPKTKQ